MVVSDGVSTSFHAAGASASTTRVVKDSLLSASVDDEPEIAMKNAIAAAHEAAMALPSGNIPNLDDPECTVAAPLSLKLASLRSDGAETQKYIV
ncbi:MAG: hypothetical protein P4L42_12565 [Desulfocapsaceae bacterium]|nr:hypothetical protein [Desulfocapsaceae bacterium]